MDMTVMPHIRLHKSRSFMMIRRRRRDLGALPLPAGERVGVRGFEAHLETLTPHPNPLPTELGLARVRHLMRGRSRINPTSAGEGADRVSLKRVDHYEGWYHDRLPTKAPCGGQRAT